MFTMLVLMSAELMTAQVKPPEPSPPPPLKPPLLRVEIVGNTDAVVRVLQVFDAGESRRADFFEPPGGKVKQVFLAMKDYQKLTDMLKSKKLPVQGKVSVKLSTPEGAAVFEEIHRVVVGPANAKELELERQRILQEEARKKDRPNG